MSKTSDPAHSLRLALSSLEIRLAKCEQKLFEQEKLLQARDEQIAGLRHEISILRDQNLAALTEIDQRGAQMVAMREAYEHSSSWRVTRPLRWLSERVHGAKAPSPTKTPEPAIKSASAANSDAKAVGAAPVVLLEGSATPPTQFAVADRHDYAEWLHRYDNLERRYGATISEDSASPTVSLLSVLCMPAEADATRATLQPVLDTLMEQSHRHWEWIIVGRPEALLALSEWASCDQRVRLVSADIEGEDQEQGLNIGLQHACGDWISWIDHRVRLRKHALLTALEHLRQRPLAQVLYADEDSINEHGNRSRPLFRCAVNMDLLLSSDYLGQFVLFRREFLVDLGGWNPTFGALGRHDVLLRLSEQWKCPTENMVHVPLVLSHRHIAAKASGYNGSRILLPCCQEGHAKAPEDLQTPQELVQSHLTRKGLQGSALPHPTLPTACRVRFELPSLPSRVGIIIPTRDNVGVLSVCLETLLQTTSYPNFDVVVVDNGSEKPETLAYLKAIEDPRVQVVRDGAPFNFSRLINRGAAASGGDLLCLLNNDMEITQSDWLEEMVGWAIQEGVAAVGARLWYGDGTLQHGGIVLGIHGIAGHAHKFLPKGEAGYLNRAVLHQTVSAVTGACLVVRRSVFDEIGGFDEALGVAYNDVDFCLRARRAGYRNVWTPHAEMIHHESISRGFEDSLEKQQRFQKEARLMRERWSEWLDNDPAYNPNLTLEHEDFGLAWPPRA